MNSELYRLLYDTKNGGGARAYECGQCGRIVRTWRGFKMHLKRVHRQEIQQALFADSANILEKNHRPKPENWPKTGGSSGKQAMRFPKTNHCEYPLCCCPDFRSYPCSCGLALNLCNCRGKICQ